MNSKTISNNSSAKLYGIGIGPGEPGLLTLKALKALEESDVLLIPKATPEKDSLAYDITKKAFEEFSTYDKIPETEDLIFPMKRNKDELKPYWDKAVDIIIDKLNKNKTVSIITLGDPTLYSTYGYLLEIISNTYPNYPVETIPGIYSFSAISSRINLPLVLGDEKVIVIPVEKDIIYKNELLNYETIVFMKVSSNFEGLLNQLIEADRTHEAILISRLGQEQETIVTNLESLKGKKIDYFSTIIVNPRIPNMVGDQIAKRS